MIPKLAKVGGVEDSLGPRGPGTPGAGNDGRVNLRDAQHGPLLLKEVAALSKPWRGKAYIGSL